MLRQCNFFLALCGATILSAAPLYSQSSSLIAAGKKEGKTVVYGSLESDTADAAFVPFKKKTGIDVEYWRASATKVMDRALSEYRAGKPLFDIILTNDNPMQIMFKEGLFAKYDSPAAKEFTPGVDRSESRSALPQRRHRRGLQQRHNQARRCAQVSRRSRQAAIPRQARHARPHPAHDDHTMGRQFG